MQEVLDSVLAPRRRRSDEGLRRAISTSLAVHVGVVVTLLVVPRDWLVKDKPAPLLMNISLGGSPGERSGGLSSAGARPIEEVAPPPKRPAPIPTATPPKSDVIAVPTKPPVKAPVKPAEPTATATTVARPPTTGAKVTTGTAAAETGSKSQDTGLTFGGGAGSTLTLDSDFCCKTYAQEVLRLIERNWKNVQPDAGTTVVVFEIRRDGSFGPPEVEKSSGSSLLDRASRAAFVDLKLPPLPKEYTQDTLKIHLAFPYVR